MPWFRLDDKGAFHAKVLAAGNEAYGAWCRAGQWSSERLTNGFIPNDVALAIAAARVWHKLRDAKAGHDQGLVIPAEGGWQIHDFLVYNPSAEQVLAERDAKREAGRRGGLSKAARQAPAVAPARQQPEHLLKQNSTPDPGPDPGSPLQQQQPTRAAGDEHIAEVVPLAERMQFTIREALDDKRLGAIGNHELMAEELLGLVIAKGLHEADVVLGIQQAASDVATEEAGKGYALPGETVAKIVRRNVLHARTNAQRVAASAAAPARRPGQRRAPQGSDDATVERIIGTARRDDA